MFSQVLISILKMSMPMENQRDICHVDFVALKAEELGRMSQHAHGLICSRFFKLYSLIELLDKGSDLVMNWMGCVAKSVI